MIFRIDGKSIKTLDLESENYSSASFIEWIQIKILRILLNEYLARAKSYDK